MSTSAPAGHRLRRAAIAVGVVFTLVVALGGTALYAVYRHLDSNITIDPSANSELRPPSSPAATNAATHYAAENILIMGSDTRVGQGGAFGSAAVYNTAHSDVVMLVHLSADRKRALVMSVPRDTWVHLPVCKSGSGTNGGFDGKFNEAFTIGGPACTIKLFEQVTGLPIDHFVVVDFNGVKEIINVLGGVQLCLKTPLKDPIANGHGSGLNLPAGQQTVMGDQGLALLRARYSFGDGSDIGRMDRQHIFLGAMVRQIQDASLLTHPTELYAILDAATRAITTDPGLGHLSALKDLAQSLTSLQPKNVTFLTIPWKDRGDGANVLIDQPRAQPILDAITNDTPWPPPPARSGVKPLRTAPASITVRVLDATGTAGEATRVAGQLRALGFIVSSLGTAPSVSATTVVHYPPAYDQSGRTLSASVPGAASVADPTLGSTLVLVVGRNFTGVQAVSVAGATPVTPTDTTTAASAGCV